MKGLSVWQPWGWLIFRPDLVSGIIRAASISAGSLKDIENRPRKWNLSGDVVIASTQKLDPNYDEIRKTVYAKFGIQIPGPGSVQMKVGGILGVVNFSLPVTSHGSPWFTGPYGYPLSNPRPLPFVAMAGGQGIYYLKPQYEKYVREQLANET